jgi:putative sugar O-methyltransferase
MPDPFLQRALRLHRQGMLAYAVKLEVIPYLLGMRYAFLRDPLSRQPELKISLHCPEYRQPPDDKKEMELVERIFSSYRAMKRDQRHAPDVYLPSSLWNDKLSSGYSSLFQGLQGNDLSPVHFFLANFGAWNRDLGIENTAFLRRNMRSWITRAYLENVVFYQQLRRWRWFYNNRKPTENLSYPEFGNQSGAYIGGHFVGVGSFFNEIYGSILRGLIEGEDRPVVADLGAGYGKLAYFTLREVDRFCFLDFDLPETLCLCAYYLMKTWPGKKALLYGEDDYSQKALDEYDLIFLPNYEMGKAGEDTIDLFMNMNSLGEMDRDAVNNYVHQIARSTRYFFHMNHDNYPPQLSGDTKAMLGYEYPVPRDIFRLLFRYLDAGHLLYHGYVDYKSDIFLYLYERKMGKSGRYRRTGPADEIPEPGRK